MTDITNLKNHVSHYGGRRRTLTAACGYSIAGHTLMRSILSSGDIKDTAPPVMDTKCPSSMPQQPKVTVGMDLEKSII